MEKNFSVLIVDDDESLASNLRDILEEEGYAVAIVGDGKSAESLCAENKFNLAIVDVRLPDINGVLLIEKLSELRTETEFIIVTGYAALETAIAAVGQRRTIAYETKPLDLAHLLPFVRQVAERHKAAQQAREAEKLYRLLAENVSDVIWTINLNMKPTYVSPSIKLLLGYTPEEILAVKFEALMSPASLEKVRADFKSLIGAGISGKDAPFIGELELRRKDGSTVWTETPTRLMHGPDGQLLGLVGVTRDITERMKSDEALRRSEAGLARAQRIAHLGNWDWDIVTNKLRWSDEIYRIFGLTPQSFGATYDAFLNSVHPDDRELVKQAVNEALSEGRPYSIDHRIFLPDGSVRVVHEEAEVTYDKKGKAVRMVGTVHDITERKATEEALRALSHRLVQVQENERSSIARELHDEIGQSLTVLKLLMNKAARSSGDTTALDEAQAQVNQLMVQVRNLSLELHPAMLDDLGLLPTLLWYFENFTAKTHVQVDFKHSGLKRAIPPDTCIAAYRIVQEGLTNATRYAGVNEVTVRAWAERGKLYIQVEDHGAGFDPTKLKMESSGLGGCSERAYALGGKFIVDTSPGAGTRVTAELPLDRTKRRKG